MKVIDGSSTSRRGRRRATATAVFGAASLALLVLQAAPSGAATTQPNIAAAAPGVLAHASTGARAAGHVVGSLARPLAGGGGYIYAEDGTYPTDGITVYSVSGGAITDIQQVTTGEQDGTFYGAENLAVVTQSGEPDCLLAVNDGTAGDDNGQISSFTIGSNGELSAAVSTLDIDGYSDDVAVDGTTAYVSDSNSYTADPSLLVYSVGTGCSLTYDSATSTGSEADGVITNVGSTVVSTDYNSGDMVAYTNSGNVLTESVNNAGELGGPQGVVALSKGSTTNVYTGQVADPGNTQGFRFTGSAFNNLTGSPVSGEECNGASVNGSVTYRLLVQANQCSGTITWDTLTPSAMAYGGETSMENTGADPTQLTVVDANLLVAGAYDGDVEDCALSTHGVTNCHTIITLPGAGSDYSGSTAVVTGTPPS